ncbi:hypothetical protein CPC197_2016 [Chlamydia psittaci C1/97]|nr:hypothetical protein CPC197_2016 [Chlamydia psittaci C1/97]
MCSVNSSHRVTSFQTALCSVNSSHRVTAFPELLCVLLIHLTELQLSP